MPPVAAGRGTGHEFSVVDLPGISRAATVIHHGSMDNVLSTGQALARWIDRNGYLSSGYLRELTLEHSHDRDLWVTELQAPIEPASAAGGR